MSTWLLTVKMIIDEGKPNLHKFTRDKKLKQQWLIKIKRRYNKPEYVMLIASAKTTAEKGCDFSWV